MHLHTIRQRTIPPEPWLDGGKIPWHEPGFSQRMLNEHLSQAHDAASRRFEIIDRQVAWIHSQLLSAQPATILDLGCGPGFYTRRLAALGHACTGIDFGPASVAYARTDANTHKLNCTYQLADIRNADYGTGFDLVMLLYGELNVFKPSDARLILKKAAAALKPGGLLLLEPHTHTVVVDLGSQPVSWYAAESGLFSAEPHIFLQESFWLEVQQVAVERFFVIDEASGRVTRHLSCTQAYTDARYVELLEESGFSAINFLPGLGMEKGAAGEGLQGIVARVGG